MKPDRVSLSKEQIAEFCQRNHIKRFAYFGSVLKDDFRSDSDIDVLVDFDPETRIGLLDVARMERQLSSLIGGHEVDIRTPEDLSIYFRNDVLAEAEVQYEQK